MAHPGFGEQRENELDLMPKSRVSTERAVAPRAGVSRESKTMRRVPDNKLTTEKQDLTLICVAAHICSTKKDKKTTPIDVPRD